MMPKMASKLTESPPSKRKHVTAAVTILESFLQWCQENKIEFAEKVECVAHGTFHSYGMVAKQDIRKEEVLFTIPRKSLLWEQNSSISKLKEETIESESGWVKLLLVLMLEYTDQQSKWRPYLNFLPSVETLDLALFWSPEERRTILHGTSLYEAVERDVRNIEKEYNDIAVPFMKRNRNFGFDLEKHSLDLFKHMAGCVMAYSFTEPPPDDEDSAPPKMVPVADILNHIAKHNAELHYENDCLKMIASQDIESGDEVFNTYGALSNSDLLQMYGFVEKYPQNINDTVQIPISSFKECNDVSSLEKKWIYLFGNSTRDGGVLEGLEEITIGMEAIQSYEELKLILEVLSMSSIEFQTCDKTLESDDSDSECDSFKTLPFKEIKETFSSKSRSVLKTVVQACCEKTENVQNEKSKLVIPEDKISRKNNILTLLNGQMSILRKLMEYCS